MTGRDMVGDLALSRSAERSRWWPLPPDMVRLSWQTLLLVAGFLAMLVPTMIAIARVSWSSDEGAHGPIVLAIAVWLILRSWPTMAARAVPGNAAVGGIALAGALMLYVAARVVGSIVIESGALYMALLTVFYLILGARGMARGWFAIAYLLFVLPPPGSVVAAATQPLRLGLSEVAVDLLSTMGYPVARSGLTIFVGQYELLVKAACAGLNSMISLTAIGLFYAYARHNANWRYFGYLLVVILALAILANFVRILLLILITYYLGDRAAQGFLHDFAGLSMFTVAVGGILLVDRLSTPLRARLARMSAR